MSGAKFFLSFIWLAVIAFVAYGIGTQSTLDWLGWAVFVVVGLGPLIAFVVHGQRIKNRHAKLTASVTTTLEPYRRAVESWLNRVQTLESFSEVEEWDSNAAATIKSIQDMTDYVEQRLSEVQNAVVLPNDKKARLQHEHDLKTWNASKQGLEQLEDMLQEKIDFTPNNKEEQKALIATLMDQKRELQLQKKEINAEIREIRREARAKSAEVPARVSARLVGVTRSRQMIALQREGQIRPHENAKTAIERQVLDLDRRIAWAKKISK